MTMKKTVAIWFKQATTTATTARMSKRKIVAVVLIRLNKWGKGEVVVVVIAVVSVTMIAVMTATNRQWSADRTGSTDSGKMRRLAAVVEQVVVVFVAGASKTMMANQGLY